MELSKEELIVEAIYLLTAFTNVIIDLNPENKRIHNRNLIGAKWSLLKIGGYIDE